MSQILKNIDEYFDTEFEKKLSSVNPSQLIVGYDGVLNSETKSRLEGEIEGKIIEKNYPKTIVRKAFFICVEALQNMLIHGFKDSNGAQHNYIILYINENQIILKAANLIGNNAVPKLTNDLSKINSFDEPAKLKEFYLEHLENNELSDKGGAGLGFITIAMKSGNKLNYQFDTLNETYSHFAIEAKINVE